MITIRQALLWAKNQLAQNQQVDDAMFEAQILLAHHLQQSRAYLIAWPEKTLTKQQLQQLETAIKRRLQQEPIAYIICKKEFWSLSLNVNQSTLIPRPETELLVEEVLKLITTPTAKIADLGTGSGAIALALATEHANWHITATDISPDALQVAQLNATQLHLTNLDFQQGAWCAALPHHDYDAIVSNPPYIAETEWPTYANGLVFEPYTALVSGNDGLTDIRVISKQAKQYLRPTGWLLLEHGYAQAKTVQAILSTAGYTNIYSVRDLGGQERITVGRYNHESTPKKPN